MADYWKSQARKFCDFCKCWIADNKPSIQFHESGKRHKENVSRRISEITKKSAKSQKESIQIDKEMKKMEEQALKAYMKDVEANPDFTSQQLLEEKQKRLEEAEQMTSTKGKEDLQKEEQSVKVVEKQWYEAKSDEGYTYYWHTVTAESVWVPPVEGYVSIEEQEKLVREQKTKKELEKLKKKEQKRLQSEEIRAAKEREEMKKTRLEEENHSAESTEESGESSAFIGPAMREDPLGAWTVVEEKVEEPIDLELPQQEYVEIKVPDLQEPVVKFKEKTITKLENDDEIKSEFGPSGFKKRKINAGARFGNIRQRLNDD